MKIRKAQYRPRPVPLNVPERGSESWLCHSRFQSVRSGNAQSARMAYLNHLIRLGRSHGKRADWLKFCRICGADISRTACRNRLCGECRGKEER